GGELVLYTLNAHGSDRRSGERRQQHPAERITQRRPVTALKRLRDEVDVVLLPDLNLDRRLQQGGQTAPLSSPARRRPGRATSARTRGLSRVVLNDGVGVEVGFPVARSRLAQHSAGHLLAVDFQPTRNVTTLDLFLHDRVEGRLLAAVREANLLP